jgi:hypothetical protein
LLSLSTSLAKSEVELRLEHIFSRHVPADQLSNPFSISYVQVATGRVFSRSLPDAVGKPRYIKI